MSCIVGFINLAGEPADPAILPKLCLPLEQRAPDQTNIRHRNHVGLAHALLTTSPGESNSRQPYSPDGAVWVTSDALLCAREELERKLLAAGVPPKQGASDVELLALAYRAFGDNFAAQIVGDFAIAIWDERQQKLLCVRDHLGLRPLFYSHVNGVFVFGSDMDALLAHPAVSGELDETFIADFLQFGDSIEKGATIYRHIRRLPPAHYLTIKDGRVLLRPYWSPTLDRVIRYSDPSDYTDHFFSILEKAVTERIPSDKIALELTGGMDSSSIAAVTAAYARQNGQQVTAYNNTTREIIPAYDEWRYAEKIAAHLGIPLQFCASEGYLLFEGFDSSALRTPEPHGNPDFALHYDKSRKVVESGCRVLFTGQLGDTLFEGSTTYFTRLLKNGQFLRFAMDLMAHRRSIGSFTNTGLLAAVYGVTGKIFGKAPWQPPKPDWFSPEFARRVDIEGRWLTTWQMKSKLDDTMGQLKRPWLSTLFEDYEAAKLPLVVRHPLCDVRLLEYVMRVPNHVLYNKRILREAMQGMLPQEILARPKEGVPGDWQKAKMKMGLCRALPPFHEIAAFVDPIKFEQAYKQYAASNGPVATWSTWLIVAPIALAYWMNNNVARIKERL